jgi:hypothetical protein
VLSWIRKGPSKKDVFVSNRIQEIWEKSSPDEWRFVPTDLNPADIPSRGAHLASLAVNQMYLSGPSFLSMPETEWPTMIQSAPELLVIEPPPSREIHHVILPSVYSSLDVFLRVNAWIQRFCHNARSLENPMSGPLRSSEITTCLYRAIRIEQKIHYPEDLKMLTLAGSVSPRSSLSRLRPVFDHTLDIILITPRTSEPPLPLLPRRSPLTDLIVMNYHQRLMHQGVEATLSELRRHFWIPKGRSLVKRLIFDCRKCRRYRNQPFCPPESVLMDFRITPAAPFTKSGLDFFGPLFLRSGSKVWVLLCTCAVIRAVHLELVSDCSSSVTFHAVRRFLARRVPPFRTVTIYSDNAKTFLRLATMRFPSHVVEWKFIPERAPHWGGWWERLVRSVKQCLRTSFRHLPFEEVELRTYLCEVETMVNSRPITHVSSDACDASPLTPNDFLYGLKPPGVDAAAIADETLKRRALLRDEASRVYWRRWSREYLASLYRWKTSTRTSASVQPHVGQIVLVKEDSPRGVWPFARILELIHRENQPPRAAWIRLHGKITRRSLNSLVPLEDDPSFATSQRGGNKTERSDEPETEHPAPTDQTDLTQLRQFETEPAPLTSRSGRVIRLPSRYRH